MTLTDVSGYIMLENFTCHVGPTSDAFLADTVDTTRLYSAVFCALHDELVRLNRHAQLTRCFSAVAELLVSRSYYMQV